MELPPVFLHRFHNEVERILHLPGNFTGAVLEMALVMDAHVPPKLMQECVSTLIRALKQQGAVFQNVRFHVVSWRSDEEITTKVLPMLLAGTESFYEDYVQTPDQKKIEKVYQYLKFYHARSKLILLVTDGCYVVGNEDEKKEAQKPFLARKLLEIKITEKGMEL